MKEIHVDEMKQLQLEILKDVADFCEKAGIRYYLTGGTMLGAVRHKGFIPWDDDIDINMPRPDYNRFVREYHHEYYEACSWDTDSNFLCTYAKVSDNRTILRENIDFGREMGINIDVFPVDGLPKGKRKIARTVRKMKTLWGLCVCATVKDVSKRRFIKKVEITLMKGFYHLFPLKSFFVGKTVKTAQRYPFEGSEKVATLVWGYGEKEVVSRSVATKYIKGDFENLKFNIPENYKEYLQSIYGDYMALPPENERVYKHGSSAYWK